MASRFLADFALFIAIMAFSMASASDPNQLQDFCVASNNPNNTLFVNGMLCKNPKEVTIDDFIYSGLNTPLNTSNIYGGMSKLVNDAVLPGLNTLGISVARFEYAPEGGLIPPHYHLRASEVLTVIEGSLLVGFITSYNYKLYSKVIYAGDAVVFPQGLIHFAINVGKTKALANAAFSSQDPGDTRIADAMFGSKSSVPVDVLSKTFQLDGEIVGRLLQTKWSTSN